MSDERAASEAQQFPRMPLYAMGALLLFSLVAVALVRLTAPNAADGAAADTAQVIERQALIFRDLDNGAVGVFDPASGALLTTIAPGTNGFMRSTLRGLGRERMRSHLTMDEPFEIRLLDNGRVLLVDPAIDREIDLWAFGESNAMNFINLYHETKAILAGAQAQLASQTDETVAGGERASHNE